MVTEVLELYERVLAVAPHHRLHELVNEVVVLLARDALVAVADVEVIVKQLLRVEGGAR